MIERIEAVLAGESGGFAHLVLNLDLPLSPAFERYEVLDGDVMFLFDDTAADREERLASWAPRVNAYRISQPIPQNGREMQDVPLFGVHLIQFDDEDAAIDYFEQYTGDRPTEPIDDASSFGDETLTFEHEYDWSGVERTELRIVTRIADTVIHLTLDGPEAAPDLADAEALMAIQVECLAAGACLERQPIPPSLLDLVCAGEAADAGEQPLGHDVEGDAPMAGADPAQTGEQAGPGPDGDPELLWRFDTAGDFHTAPVVADGLVFAGSGGSESGQDGTFYALDAATGERAWCIPTGGFHPNTSAAADGLIVSPEIDPRVQRGTGAAIVARIANTGEELWRVPTGGSAADLLIADRTVFVVTVDTLSALDLETGAYRWHVTLESSGEDAAFTGLAIADGLVYAGYFLGFEQPYGIYALDAESGNERWTYEQENFMEEGTWLTGGPVVAGGMVFAGNSFGGFSALDATSGEVVWTFVPSIESWEGAEHDGMNFNAPAVVDGVVYVGTGSSQGDHDDDRFLYALDAETGEERWAHEADTPILMQPAIVDGVAYVGDISGTLLAIDTESGDLIWDYHLDGELGRDGLAVVDGVIYLATRDGSLYAITGENRQGL